MFKKAKYMGAGIGAGLGALGGYASTGEYDSKGEKAAKILSGAALGGLYGHSFSRAKEEATGGGYYNSRSWFSGAGAGSRAGNSGASDFNKAKNKFSSEFNRMDKDAAKRRYKEYAKKYHPDVGGDEETFKALNEAYNSLFKGR